MLNKKTFIGVLLCFGLFLASFCAKAENIKETEHTKIEIFAGANNEYIARLSLQDGWHIYWSNPGEIGKPTQILPAGNWQIINQSKPKISTPFEGIEEFIYEGTAYFHLRRLSQENPELTFSFVECSDSCKEENVSFDTAALKPATPNIRSQIYQEMQKIMPQKLTLHSMRETGYIETALPFRSDVRFIPAQADTVEPDTPKVTNNYGKAVFSWQNYADRQLTKALVLTPDVSYTAEIIYDGSFAGSGLIYILLLAFFAGILLNAMPCVFPVLSLKLLTLIKNKESTAHFRNAFLYTLGVLFSFWLLTALLLFLKQQGNAAGWGFQLQSPLFTGSMSVIFLVLFLALIEIIHFPAFITDRIYKLSGAGQFSSGFFAVLIASPCTGPFMGAALGYALMSGTAAETFAVFTVLALGYALPYALLELYPSFMSSILPKPDKWMQTVKYILAVPLLLTSVWLAGISYTQLRKNSGIKTDGELVWIPYNEEKIRIAAENGENVFIDFTADWCLTCKFNEKLILNSSRFRNTVKKLQIHLYKADLTEDNQEYLRALNAYGRDSIPLYVYYRNGKYKILPLFFSMDSLKD